MIYAIAAYSITLSVLALYAVVLQHRSRVLQSSLAGENGSAGFAVPDPRRGFNVGAALLAPIWMWAHGMRWPAAVLGVLCVAMVPLAEREMWVPLIFVATVPAAASAALAVVGNRIGVAHRGAEDAGVYAASQLPWAVAGIVLHTVVIPWAWYFSRAAG